MNECDDCELRGYSRELCLIHIRHCRRHPERRPVAASLRIGARAAGGVALGATAGLLVATAASFVGGPVLFYAVMLKLVAGGGLVGGGWGLARGVAAQRAGPTRPAPRRPSSAARRPAGRSGVRG